MHGVLESPPKITLSKYPAGVDILKRFADSQNIYLGNFFSWQSSLLVILKMLSSYCKLISYIVRHGNVLKCPGSGSGSGFITVLPIFDTA